MVNKVTLIGYAGNDPEVRTIETGSKVARISLATNESYKDKEGNWQTQTEWHNVILWRDLAERAGAQIKKGSFVYVDGKISTRKYTDKDGVEKSMTDIVANTFRLLEKREKSENNNFSSKLVPSNDPANNYTGELPSGDDLPF